MSAKTYDFTIQGKAYSIPLFKDMPIKVLRKTRHITNEMDMAFTVIELAIKDESILEALDTLTVEEFSTWQQGWLGEASMGESSGSES